MARSVNYAAKIEKLEEKISKKKAELDRLQEELKVLKQKKDEHDYGALLDYMKENNLSAEQVLTSIKPEERVAQS
ncbi:MAG: protein kinase [Selenomonas sp.]|nr:protein kinase [Selenomonas sp.]